ncbi:YdcF family protein [Tahibacter amnicola]|uniref:YdcF family protein n=1 Tax=Tahibacter amnicola TaxID=2976241 RepID=A0ABY6BLK8_9GAMM|nr:YdcF family protein [Tahibacter amnicola]UXI68697.1 YdcF family protein [Tahibacter amnicola]
MIDDPQTDAAAPARPSRWKHLGNPDVWHSLLAAALACAATGGLLLLLYGLRAWRTARSAATAPVRAQVILVFGKRLVNAGPDADYVQRLCRAHALVQADPRRRVLLLGGTVDEGPTEAQAGLATLQQMGLPRHCQIECEDASIDTLENLRHARILLGADAGQPVALVSSRYHLERCRLLALSLGFDVEMIGAEAPWRPRLRDLGRLAMESGYCLWLEVGTRYARLIGHRRMLDRVS